MAGFGTAVAAWRETVSRLTTLTVLLRVLFAVLRAFGFGPGLAGRRLPDGDDKGCIVEAIVKAQKVMPLRKILLPIGLSPSRFHAWKRAPGECGLEDQSNCPKSSPQQLLPEEARTIREMVLSEEYRHVPTGTLALLAQRLGRVFAAGLRPLITAVHHPDGRRSPEAGGLNPL